MRVELLSDQVDFSSPQVAVEILQPFSRFKANATTQYLLMNMSRG